MTKYDPALDDDEWRKANFSEVKIASASNTNANQPSVAELLKAAEKYGTDGILESAIALSQSDYKRVEEAVVKLNGGKRGRR